MDPILHISENEFGRFFYFTAFKNRKKYISDEIFIDESWDSETINEVIKITTLEINKQFNNES